MSASQLKALVDQLSESLVAGEFDRAIALSGGLEALVGQALPTLSRRDAERIRPSLERARRLFSAAGRGFAAGLRRRTELQEPRPSFSTYDRRGASRSLAAGMCSVVQRS